MKLKLFGLLLLTSSVAFSQTIITANKVEARNRLTLGANTVLEIGKDSVTTFGSDFRLITEKAAKAYTNTKQPLLVSGTNIKTVNGTSLLGTGNITIAGGGGSFDTATIYQNLNTNYAQGVANANAIQTKQATLVSGTNIKTVNGTSLLGSGNITIAGGSGGIDSGAYRYVTQLADSSGFILHRPNGTKDTILVNLGPGVNSYVANQTSGANGLITNTMFQVPGSATSTIPSTAIGGFTGLNFSQVSAPAYGGIIGSDQEGNFFTRKSNGSTWYPVLTSNNINTYAPTNGVQYNATANVNSLTTPPSLFTYSSGTAPSAAIGAIAGLNLAHPTVSGYGGTLVSDQEGSFWVRKNNAGASWRKVIDEGNVSSFVPSGVSNVLNGTLGSFSTTPVTFQGISSAPAGSTGQIGGIVFPHSGAANYGGIIASDQTGTFWLRTNNAGASWRKVIDESNISSFGLTNSNGVGYQGVGDVNAWNGNSMYYGGTNIPSDATGLTGFNLPYNNLSNYGNQIGVDRYGKWYVRNNNGGSFGVYKRISTNIATSTTYDAPSIATLSSTTTWLAVTGAKMGDIAKVSFNVNLNYIMATAYVSSDDVVTVVLFNPTASSIDLASATLKVWVETN